MNQKDIDRIEKSFGAKLHPAYVECLLSYPKELTNAISAVRLAPDERELFNSAKPIIAMNKLVRRPNHLIDPDDDDSKWPGEYFIIGMDIGANFYCLKLGAVRPTVYFWFHETNEFEKFAKNLDDFISKIIAKHSA